MGFGEILGKVSHLQLIVFSTKLTELSLSAFPSSWYKYAGYSRRSLDPNLHRCNNVGEGRRQQRSSLRLSIFSSGPSINTSSRTSVHSSDSTRFSRWLTRWCTSCRSECTSISESFRTIGWSRKFGLLDLLLCSSTLIDMLLRRRQEQELLIPDHNTLVASLRNDGSYW